MEYQLKTVFKTGRHQGKTVEWAIENDIIYIDLCCQEAKNFQLATMAKNLYLQKRGFDEIEIKTSDNQKTIMKIESLKQDINLTNIKSLGGDLAKVFEPFLAQIPSLYATNQLSNAYRFIIPEGAMGEIMKIKDGQGVALLVDGKINSVGHYVSVNASPLVIFSVMSAMTGLYYMHRIDKSLRQISDEIHEFKNFMIIDKVAENESIFLFINDVNAKFDDIVLNEANKMATLTNLIDKNIKLRERIIFYEKAIYGELNKTKKNEDTEISKENLTFLLERHKCIEMYMLGKILYFRLANITHDSYYHELQVQIQQIIETNNQILQSSSEICFENLYDKWNSNLKFPIGFESRKAIAYDKYKLYDSDMKALYKRAENRILHIKNTIDLLLNKEFIYKNGELYLEK